MEQKVFDEMYKVETQHWWFVARRKIIESVIKNLKLEKTCHILDAGCGNGDNLVLLSKYGNVTAMERDSNALSKARSRQTGKVFQGELPDRIPAEISKDNDLIVMLDVLEHINNDAESLVSLRGVAKDSGTIIISVLAYQFLWTYHDEKHHHKRRYTVNGLKELVESNGWRVDYVSYFNFFLFPLAVVDRIKQKIFPKIEDSNLKMPPKFINSIFEKVFSIEANLIGKFVFPFGLSIMLVAKKI